MNPIRTLSRRMPSVRALAGFSIALVLLLVANDQLLRFAAKANPASRVNWLFQTPPTSYEIAILGSSMAKESIDPALLAQSSGLPENAVVQLAWGGRGVSEQALYLELFLQRHKCKRLLVELHPRGLEEDVLGHPLDEFRYFTRLDSPIVFRHLTRQFGFLRTKLWQVVPMWGFALFSSQTGWHDVLALRRGEAFDPNKIGQRELNQITDLNENQSLLQQQSEDPSRQPGFTPISVRSKEQFAEIVELCNISGIEVVAFVPPIYGATTSDNWLADYRKILGDEVQILKAAGSYLTDPAAFSDSLHVNALGRREYTQELAVMLP